MGQQDLEFKQNKEEPQLLNSGPVFEPGPGWGAKIKNWFKKYFYKAILPIIIALLIIYGLTSREKSDFPVNTMASPSPSAESIVAQEVQRGDSRTTIARRALAEYLTTAIDDILTAGQKVFIENKLSQSLTGAILKIGTSIEIKTDDIKSVIEESKQLTQSQLQKWEEFAQKVKF